MKKEDIAEIQYEYDERAAIIEFDGGLERETAEQEAAVQLGYSNKEEFDDFVRSLKSEQSITTY